MDGEREIERERKKVSYKRWRATIRAGVSNDTRGTKGNPREPRRHCAVKSYMTVTLAVPLTELHLSRFNCAELLTGSRRYGHRPRERTSPPPLPLCAISDRYQRSYLPEIL